MSPATVLHFPGVRLSLDLPPDWRRVVDSVYGAFREPRYPFPESEAMVAVAAREGGWGWSTSLGGGRQGTWSASAGPAEVLALLQQGLLVSCTQARLFHAAVVARNGSATLVAGPSNLGKTTFCAHLVLSGWDFLSDEAAVLPFGDATVLAFPRALSLRAASLDVLAAPDSWRARTVPWDGESRVLLDTDDLRPGSLLPRAGLARVVFLRAPAAAPPPGLEEAEFLEIDTAGCTDRFLNLLEFETGVLRVDRLDDRPGATVRIAHLPGAAVSAAVDVCARREGVRVTAHGRGCTAPLRRDRPPRLRPLEPLDGVRRLLAHLLNGRALAAARPLPQLFSELVAETREARFFEMIPGPLADMGALLEF